MSAAETAIRVLEWAMFPQGPPPTGDPADMDALIRPEPRLADVLGRLAAKTAARLRVCPQDPRPLGPETAVLAAAIGLRRIPKLVFLLLRVVEPALSPPELLARHGLVSPSLPHLDTPLALALKRQSPLTGLLQYPPAGLESRARNLAGQWCRMPGGRRSLQLHFAQPVADRRVRDWRADLMERWRPVEGALDRLVLDIYETTMIYHGKEALDQVHRAANVFLDPILAADDQRLKDAQSVARWWKPLHRLERTRPRALRARRYLGYQYREGVKLYQLFERLMPTSVSRVFP